MTQKGSLVVISGFSGVGKGTVISQLMKTHEEYALSVSCTTRAPREGEMNGREYFFLSREEFERKISEDAFIEYATYCDNYYGTPRSFVEEQLRSGKNVILEIEVQGAMKVKTLFPEAILIFIMPPSGEELIRRLCERGTESLDKIQARIDKALVEAESIDDYEFIVVNENVPECAAKIHELTGALRARTIMNRPFIETVREQIGSAESMV